jgi:hypothetical protein
MNFPSAEELFLSGGLEEEEESSSTLSTSAMIEQFLWQKVVAGQKYRTRYDKISGPQYTSQGRPGFGTNEKNIPKNVPF